MTGCGQGELSKMLLSDRLGPALSSKTNGQMPLFHLAALVSLQQGAKAGVPGDMLQSVLFRIAGAAFIRLALTEHAAGRCVIRPGLGSNQLWTTLKLGDGRSVIEEQLPLSGLSTKRFAFFSGTDVGLYDLCDLEHVDFQDSPRLIDSWGIARRMKGSLAGTLFWTEPASS
jgi:hypothetical protein